MINEEKEELYSQRDELVYETFGYLVYIVETEHPEKEFIEALPDLKKLIDEIKKVDKEIGDD